VYLILNVLPQLPGMEYTRDLGLAMYAALLLWVTAVIKLWRVPAEEQAVVSLPAVSWPKAAEVGRG
jgi:hypothetical protein